MQKGNVFVSFVGCVGQLSSTNGVSKTAAAARVGLPCSQRRNLSICCAEGVAAGQSRKPPVCVGVAPPPPVRRFVESIQLFGPKFVATMGFWPLVHFFLPARQCVPRHVGQNIGQTGKTGQIWHFGTMPLCKATEERPGYLTLPRPVA